MKSPSNLPIVLCGLLAGIMTMAIISGHTESFLVAAILLIIVVGISLIRKIRIVRYLKTVVNWFKHIWTTTKNLFYRFKSLRIPTYMWLSHMLAMVSIIVYLMVINRLRREENDMCYYVIYLYEGQTKKLNKKIDDLRNENSKLINLVKQDSSLFNGYGDDFYKRSSDGNE